MIRAIPLHHPTAAELHAAHVVYEEQEPRAYAYRLARQFIASDAPGAEYTTVEAVDLLLRVWNPRAPQTRALTLAGVRGLLEETADARWAFADRHIATLTEVEHAAVAEIYGSFRNVLGPVGASKALGALHPRFFPLWDTEIADAYVGANFRKEASYYLQFMDYCIEQCTTNVAEAAFGDGLLKTLDEWNYCLWSNDWIEDPR